MFTTAWVVWADLELFCVAVPPISSRKKQKRSLEKGKLNFTVLCVIRYASEKKVKLTGQTCGWDGGQLLGFAVVCVSWTFAHSPSVFWFWSRQTSWASFLFFDKAFLHLRVVFSATAICLWSDACKVRFGIAPSVIRIQPNKISSPTTHPTQQNLTNHASNPTKSPHQPRIQPNKISLPTTHPTKINRTN